MQTTDLDAVLEWRNDENVRSCMYTNHVIERDEHRAWWARCQMEPGRHNLVAEIEGDPVGFVSFTGAKGRGATASWAFFAKPGATKGTGTAMELAALHFAFSTLELGKLECEVLSFNDPVVRLHLRHGFRIEGRLKGSYEREGRRFDIIRLGMTAEAWTRYIRPHLESLQGQRDPEIGTSVIRQVTLDADAVGHFAAATGDNNPIHSEPLTDIGNGVKGAIAHGMLLASQFSRLFSEIRPGPGSIYVAQEIQFIRPVQVGAAVTVKATVIARIGRRYTFETEILTAEGLACRGTAEVLAAKGACARSRPELSV